jgi:hypothetical protein
MMDSEVSTTRWQEEWTTPALTIQRGIEPLVGLAFSLIQPNGLDNIVNDNFASLPCGTAMQGSGH